MTPDRTCQRCGKRHLREWVWLELSNRTNRFALPGGVPEGESQGLFPFGRACARRQLLEDVGVTGYTIKA